MFGNNQSVLSNTTELLYALSNFSNILEYFVKEGFSYDEWSTAYVYTDYNPEDILDHNFSSGVNRYSTVCMSIYDIYPWEKY